MRASFWARIAVVFLAMAVVFASAQNGQVFGYSHHDGHVMMMHHDHDRGRSFFAFYSPYYSYYYSPYFYYPYFYSAYSYPYYYGGGMYGGGMNSYYGGTYGGMYGGMNSYYGYGGYSTPAKYQLTVNTNPASLSGQVTGGGSYSSGAAASFSVSQNLVQTAPDTRYVFQGWSGGYSGSGTSGSVTMASAMTVTAVYQTQYLLSISPQPSGAPSPQGSGWFNAGATTSISVPAQIVSQNTGSQLIFNGWNVDGSVNQGVSTLSLQMNAPHTVAAQYTQQYYLTVQSSQGVVFGQGWYNAGTNAQISVTTPPNPSYGVNAVFDGWQGSTQSSTQSTTVLMNSPMSVTATWHNDYTVFYITIAAIIAGIAVAAIALTKTKNRRQTQLASPQQQTQPTSTPQTNHSNP